MNEIITILTSGSRNQIAKALVGSEYVQQRFSIGSSFTAHEEPVSDLHSLSRILSKRSSHTAAAITVPAFSDPRIKAVQKQIREAETVQAIARLRLVWADYQKRVFL